MNTLRFGRFCLFPSFLVLCGGALYAQRTTIPTTTSRTPASRTASSTQLRPDPAILDGSSHPAEKRNEFGMIGDFEMPGPETRSDRVGGAQAQPGGGTDELTKPGGGAPPVAAETPPGGAPAPTAEAAGQPGGTTATQPQQQQGGIPGTPNPIEGATGGEAQGVQVAQLGGASGGTDPGQPGSRPRAVTIGDKAMQIPLPNAAIAGVNAQQPAGATQHHEKPTGTGGKPPVGDNTNKGVERGRTMPAGL